MICFRFVAVAVAVTCSLVCDEGGAHAYLPDTRELHIYFFSAQYLEIHSKHAEKLKSLSVSHFIALDISM
jgi:hypothetical protein